MPVFWNCDMYNSAKCGFFGDTAVFQHIAIAVASIDEACPGLEKTEDPVNKVTVAFADIHGLHVEFVEPLTEDSPVKEILAKGQALYHVCYAVPDIEAAVEVGRTHGFHAISKPALAVAFDDQRIIWLFHRTLGLVELVEKA